MELLGGIFEHSSWIAFEAWDKKPFASLEDLYEAMWSVVQEATPAQQLALIRAHPDLVGQGAREGRLTEASNREQARAGLNQLSTQELKSFDEWNAQYWDRFGFPFIICAKENKKELILRAFPIRLKQTPEEEKMTALAEIKKIAWYRLLETFDSTSLNPERNS